MPVADYKCEGCGYVVEHQASPLPASIAQEHDVKYPLPSKCPNETLTRVWSTFGVGHGTSGKTPPR